MKYHDGSISYKKSYKDIAPFFRYKTDREIFWVMNTNLNLLYNTVK